MHRPRRSSHFILHTSQSHPTRRSHTPHSTSTCGTAHTTSHSTRHTPHFTPGRPRLSLHTSHSTLHAWQAQAFAAAAAAAAALEPPPPLRAKRNLRALEARQLQALVHKEVRVWWASYGLRAASYEVLLPPSHRPLGRNTQPQSYPQPCPQPQPSPLTGGTPFRGAMARAQLGDALRLHDQV